MAGAISMNLEFTENEQAINPSPGELRILLSAVTPAFQSTVGL